MGAAKIDIVVASDASRLRIEEWNEAMLTSIGINDRANSGWRRRPHHQCRRPDGVMRKTRHETLHFGLRNNLGVIVWIRHRTLNAREAHTCARMSQTRASVLLADQDGPLRGERVGYRWKTVGNSGLHMVAQHGGCRDPSSTHSRCVRRFASHLREGCNEPVAGGVLISGAIVVVNHQTRKSSL
jgi:hypothetical protein